MGAALQVENARGLRSNLLASKLEDHTPVLGGK